MKRHTTNNSQNSTLNALRFPLAFIILALHIFGTVITVSGETVSMDNYTYTKGILYFLKGLFEEQSVPIFFFISGYVFFLKGTFSFYEYKQKIKKRFHTLFIPYIVWNVLFLGYMLLKYLPVMRNVFPNLDTSQLDLNLCSVLSIFGDYSGGIDHTNIAECNEYYPLNGPLWYIRELMLTVLLSPLIYKFIYKWKVKALWVIGSVWFIFHLLNLKGNQTATSMLFFAWGAYISIFQIDIARFFHKYKHCSIIAFLILGLTTAVCMHYLPVLCPFIKGIDIVVGIYAAYNAGDCLVKAIPVKVNQYLASTSFFLYSTHFIIYKDIIKIYIKLLTPDNSLTTLCIYLFSILTCVLVLLSTHWFLKKYTPALLTFLTGRK